MSTPAPTVMHRSAYEERLAALVGVRGLTEEAARAALSDVTVIGDDEPLPTPPADSAPDGALT